MFSSIFPIGSMVGPIVGGVITQYWVWRGIFFINVPIGIALFLLALRFIPRTESRESGRLDFRGMALLSSTIVVAMLAITLLGERTTAFSILVMAVSALGAVILGWLLMRHTRRREAPLIPLRLLQGKEFLDHESLERLLRVSHIRLRCSRPPLRRGSLSHLDFPGRNRDVSASDRNDSASRLSRRWRFDALDIGFRWSSDSSRLPSGSSWLRYRHGNRTVLVADALLSGRRIRLRHVRDRRPTTPPCTSPPTT